MACDPKPLSDALDPSAKRHLALRLNGLGQVARRVSVVEADSDGRTNLAVQIRSDSGDRGRNVYLTTHCHGKTEDITEPARCGVLRRAQPEGVAKGKTSILA